MKPETPVKLPSRSQFRGCLLGGAIGDALGAPVEFMTRAQIRERYGENGVERFEVAYGRRGAVTDDTQMTMFTAEGLLQALRQRREGIEEKPEVVVHRAYLRWLRTQQFGADLLDSLGPDRSGRLIDVPALHARRAPGDFFYRKGRKGLQRQKLLPKAFAVAVLRVLCVEGS